MLWPMRFSLQLQYAICGCFDLAYSGGDEPVGVREIAERQAIPVRYLEQIFGRLRRAGLVHSKRGPGGGFTLARAPAEISLCEIVEAIEGPLSDALEMEPPDRAAGAAYRPDFLWPALAEALCGALRATTLADLCRQAAREQLPGAREDAPMYFI